LTGLFVKPAGVAEGRPAESGAPVTDDNMRALAIEAAGGVADLGATAGAGVDADATADAAAGESVNADSYGPTYFQVPENAPVHRSYFFRPDYFTDYVEEFDVTGDASDFANWRKVGNLPVKYDYVDFLRKARSVL
jgi:hypothetical protein